MKIIITGAHFTPAQAVIEELKKNSDVEITYIGRLSTREGDKSPSVESQVLPKLGVKFLPLTTGRLQRALTLYTIPSLSKIPWGILQAFYYLMKERPDVVLSFGGYLAVPVVIAAWFLSIPVIIHEQTLVCGLSTTLTSPFAQKIAISYLQNPLAKQKKAVLTGNPMRKEIIKAQGSDFHNLKIKQVINICQKEKLPLIFITGGNQGSHVINEAVEEILDEITPRACLIHQTGDSKFQDFEALEKRRASLKFSERFLPLKWIEVGDMGNILKRADLTVTRAGANILQELAYFQVPSLVIPLPYLSQDEQNVNAKFFADLGLVKILPQKELSAASLWKNIQEMINNLAQFKKAALDAKTVVISDSAQRLALETLLLAKGLKI